MTLLGRSQSVLATNFGLDTAYDSTDAANPIASWTLTLHADGRWTITVGAGDVLSVGSPASGTWLQGGGIGAEFEAQFTNANNVNTPVITNGAAAYTQVSSDLSIEVSRAGGVAASSDITVNVRALGTTTPVLTDTTTVTVDGT